MKSKKKKGNGFLWKAPTQQEWARRRHEYEQSTGQIVPYPQDSGIPWNSDYSKWLHQHYPLSTGLPHQIRLRISDCSKGPC